MIAKEITKLHETFYRDNVKNIKLFKTKIKGELTVVISEKNIKDKVFDENKIKKSKNIIKKNSTLKDTVELLFEH